MEKRFYRIDDVAEMLGVHRNTISNWIKQGKLKTSVIGGIKLIPSTEIDRLEKGQEPKNKKVADNWKGILDENKEKKLINNKQLNQDMEKLKMIMQKIISKIKDIGLSL